MPSDLRTGHAALDRIAARRLVHTALLSPTTLREACAEAFLHGSPAAADGAATELLAAEYTDATAAAVRPLASVVPPENATALAAVAARLTVTLHAGTNVSQLKNDNTSRGDSVSRWTVSDTAQTDALSPISSFGFCINLYVRSAAVEAALKELEIVSIAVEGSPEAEVVIARVVQSLSAFVVRILQENKMQSPLAFRCVRALCKLAEQRGGYLQRHVLELVINQGFLPRSPSMYVIVDKNEGDICFQDSVRFDEEYTNFVVGEIANQLSHKEMVVLVARKCILRVIEVLDVRSFAVLWMGSRERVQEALTDVGVNNTVFAMCMIALANAMSGNLLRARDAIFLARGGLLQSKDGSQITVHGAVAAVAAVTALAVGALASSGGADELSQMCIDLESALTKARVTNSCSSDAIGLFELRRLAVASGCFRASFVFGMLSALYERWNKPSALAQWLANELKQCCELWRESSEGDNMFTAMSRLPDERSGSATQNMSASITGMWTRQHFSLYCALLCCSSMLHSDCHVRVQAVSTFACVPSANCCFTFFPVLLSILSKERNGVVASRIMRTAISSSAMIREKITAKHVLLGLVNLAYPRPGGSLLSISTVEAGLTAIAASACAAPTSAFPVLLSQIEAIDTEFSNTLGPVKTAAMSSAVEVIAERPSRGPNFIPLIQKCITAEAVESNPAAAALSFLAMRDMVVAEVLDPAKAIKIVLKTFDNPVAVPFPARKCYIALLGAASQAMKTRKGQPQAIKVLKILRHAIEHLAPCEASGTLSWIEINQVALSLSRFEVNDILRVEYCNDMPEDDVEKERLRLNAIEEEVMKYTADIIRIAGSAQRYAIQVGGKCRTEIDALSRLLQKIAVAEWSSRSRSLYDSGKLSKMRAASEALRRARVRSTSSPCGTDSSGASCPNSNQLADSSAHNDYCRAVVNLPTGAIKAFSIAAGDGLSNEDGSSCAEVKNYSSASALESIALAKAFSPSVPWIALIAGILESRKPSLERAKVSSMKALFAVPQENYDVMEYQRKLFDSENLPSLVLNLPIEAVQVLLRSFTMRGNVSGVSQVMRCFEKSTIVCEACVDAMLGADLSPDKVMDLSREVIWQAQQCLNCAESNGGESICRQEQLLKRLGGMLGDTLSVETAISLLKFGGPLTDPWSRRDMVHGTLLAYMSGIDAMRLTVRKLAHAVGFMLDNEPDRRVMKMLLRALIDTIATRLSRDDRRLVLLELIEGCEAESCKRQQPSYRRYLHAVAAVAGDVGMLSSVDLKSVDVVNEKKSITDTADTLADVEQNYENLLALAAAPAIGIAREDTHMMTVVGTYCQRELQRLSHLTL